MYWCTWWILLSRGFILFVLAILFPLSPFLFFSYILIVLTRSFFYECSFFFQSTKIMHTKVLHHLRAVIFKHYCSVIFLSKWMFTSENLSLVTACCCFWSQKTSRRWITIWSHCSVLQDTALPWSKSAIFKVYRIPVLLDLQSSESSRILDAGLTLLTAHTGKGLQPCWWNLFK